MPRSRYPLNRWVPDVRKVKGQRRDVWVRRRVVRRKSVYDVKIRKQQKSPEVRTSEIFEEYRDLISDFEDLNNDVLADMLVSDPAHYDFQNVDTKGRGQYAGEGYGANKKHKEAE